MVLVVYLFLGSLRATLIPTLAVPVSLIGAFIVLNAIGYSANTVSLLAIVLAIGIVVDDAIVVVENVERVMEEHPELSPAEATKRAMAEITAPIIAITLVLLSVFVPVAFIPGISGELFRQFAVTVAVSMFLSAINALTLSPALCGVFLRPHHGPRRGLIGIVMRSIDRVRDAYGDAVARIVRFSFIGIVMVAVAAAGTVALLRVTPTGFLPEDDQGAFFVVIQLPGGASVARTLDVVGQAEQVLKKEETVADYTSVVGVEFHRQLLAVERRLHRRHVEAVRGAQGRGSWRHCASSRAWDRNSGRSAAAWCCRWRRRRSSASAPAAASPMCWRICAAAIRRRSPKSCAGSPIAANEDPRLTRVFSTFSATNPSIYLDIDRDKAQILGVPLNNVFQALQASLGGYYRQQRQSVRAHLAGPGAGGGAGSARPRRHLSHQCAQRGWEDDPVAQPGRTAGRRRPGRADPLQQSEGRHDSRRPGAGHLHRTGAAGDGGSRGAHAAQRAMPANGPTPPSRKSARKARPR